MRVPSAPTLGAGLALLLWLLSLRAMEALDRRTGDLASRLARSQSGTRQVVLVGLDEATEQAYSEPLALWHRRLGGLFEALAQARPRAVGVDLALPPRSFDELLPGGDAALARGLVRLRRACPVVLGVTVDGEGQVRPLRPLFEGIVGEEGRGFVVWPVDPDGVVRAFSEHPHGRRETLPTVAGQLARALGRPVRDGPLDFRAAPPVPYLPMHQVVAWGRGGRTEALRSAFEGKVVMVGSVLPFVDRHFQVVDLNGWGEENRRFAPGVLLHVQAVENLLGEGPLRRLPPWLVWGLALAMGWLGHVQGTRAGRGALGVLLALLLLLALVLLALTRGWVLPPSLPGLALILAYGLRFGLDAWEQRRLARCLERAFGGFVSPPVLKRIKAGELHPGLEGEKVRLCVLFSDVRGFTTLSEGRDPKEIIALLNRYFDRMVPAIHAHGGTLDKYMGDGIMAHFGHPEPLENPCRAAFEASRAMLAALASLNGEFEARGLVPLRIGIGLHVGEAVVGHIGSKERHEYTLIGDTVNVASRVEGLTKEAGYPLLLTGAVSEDLQRGDLVPLGPKAIKGHSAMEMWGWKG